MLKVSLAVLPMERGNQLGQGERSLSGPFFPTPQAKLARGTPPTTYYRQSAGSAANFALGLTGLPRGHRDQSRIPRPHTKMYYIQSVLTNSPPDPIKNIWKTRKQKT